jgi:hypothetical protein
MKFETIDGLPILLEIDIEEKIFELLYNQLLTGIKPILKSDDEELSYILLLEQLTGGNSSEIKEIIKEIKFSPRTYTFLVDYGFKSSFYVNKYVTTNEIISAFLSKYKMINCENDVYKEQRGICKFDLKCKCHYDAKYNCKYLHNTVEIDDKTKNRLVKDLSNYGLLFLGKKELFKNKYCTYNYDNKLLSSDNTLYDIIFENEYAFAFNPQKFLDREKYQYSEHDKYDEEISVLTTNDNYIKLRKIALFKPYHCCRSIFYHIHGH